MNTVLTDLALADLDSLRSFIAADNPVAAKKVVSQIFEAIARITKLPSMGRPGRVPATRELLVAPYLVVYTVDGDRLMVLRVIHSARNWPPAT